jgi:osmoprotectant transport system ATP-binding protein
MIVLDEVSKSFDDGQSYAVRDLSLQVRDGEMLVLLGSSGCGKTTTLKMINRLIEPTSGTIRVDDRDVTKQDPVALRRTIGYVFQGVGLFPHMTVGENVTVVPHLLGWPKDRTAQKRDELLDLVKLRASDFSDRWPRDLSGGQRQRVGLARAMAGEPRIMLLDEPFGALDPLNRDLLQQEYRRIHDEFHLTSVMVTHDMTEALLMADRIAVMKRGQIVQVDTPHKLLSSPADEYVEQLIATPKRHADRLEKLVAEVDGP